MINPVALPGGGVQKTTLSATALQISKGTNNAVGTKTHVAKNAEGNVNQLISSVKVWLYELNGLTNC